jgi:hypothetical protein
MTPKLERQRRDLYTALWSRVLTEAEMTEVLRWGWQITIATSSFNPNCSMSEPYKQDEKQREFTNALSQQLVLRQLAATRPLQETDTDGEEERAVHCAEGGVAVANGRGSGPGSAGGAPGLLRDAPAIPGREAEVASSLLTEAENWITQVTKTAYGDRGLRLQIEAGATVLDRLAEALRQSLAREQQMQQDLDEMLVVLKAACDRAWSNETPVQVANVAANAIYWRGQEVDWQKTRRNDELQTLLAIIKERKELQQKLESAERVRDTLTAQQEQAFTAGWAGRHEYNENLNYDDDLNEKYRAGSLAAYLASLKDATPVPSAPSLDQETA